MKAKANSGADILMPDFSRRLGDLSIAIPERLNAVAHGLVEDGIAATVTTDAICINAPILCERDFQYAAQLA